MTEETPAVEYQFDTHDQFLTWEDDHLLTLSCLTCGEDLRFAAAAALGDIQADIDAHLQQHAEAEVRR